ncbi:hypothetical protein Hypma_006388 [Hypsizygus marmoreus]|uniref:Uncharacterized protein n=1 Tax=Hypsizygus marmoreus TaxID=39966 RepID=A0A369JUV0_HYPMA|nr:hypothetical protein Hypma_006388 [Hypsizygus marmoreus]
MAELGHDQLSRFPPTSTPFVCKPLVRNTIATKDDSKRYTKTGEQVERRKPPGLGIKRSDHLWDRLVSYADRTNDHVYRHTYDRPEGPRAIPDPSRAAFRDAIRELDGLKYYLEGRTPAPVSSTVSVTDEAKAQIIEVLNTTIKTRYQNQANDVTPPPVHPPMVLPPPGPQPPLNLFKTTADTQIAPDRGTDHVQYPIWLRSCPAYHEFYDRDNAGFPDFLLCRSPLHSGKAAVCEIKPYWVYRTGNILDTYFIDPVGNGTIPAGLAAQGYLDSWVWEVDSSAHMIIRQVYGEMLGMGTKLAFVSNTDICIAMMLVPRAGGEDLVLSLPKRWTDPTLITALTGLTFAAIDQPCWTWPGQSVVDVLCPENERVSLRTALPAQTVDMMTALLGQAGLLPVQQIPEEGEHA